MNKVGWFLFPLSLSMFLASFLIAPSPRSGSHTVEKIEGPMRTVERFDDHGKRHGLNEVYENNTLSQSQMYEHGMLIEWIIYKPDGSIKQHFKEGDDYNLSPVD